MNITRHIDDTHVCTLTFDRAGSSANVFDRATLEELDAHLAHLEQLTVVRGVILMTAPGFASEFATKALASGPGAWVAAGIAIAIGLWLTWAGWFTRGAG